MSDSLMLGEICELVCGTLQGGSAATPIVGVCSVVDGCPDRVSWISDATYTKYISTCKAAAVIGHQSVIDTPLPLIHVDDPESAIAQVLNRFAIPIERPRPGVHPTAIFEDGFTLGEGVCIGSHVRIGRNSSIGPRCILHAGAH